MGEVRIREIGRRLRLVPYWAAGRCEPDRLNVVIDPGPAFGAGDHPTTVMALEFLEEAMLRTNMGGQAPTVFDCGAGTGVLGIAALALGAGFTVACDIDPAAVFTARRNMDINRLTGGDSQGRRPAAIFIGTADSVRFSFDIVIANLAGPVLVRLSDDLTRLAGKFLILAGIADIMEQSVMGSYARFGFEIIEKSEREIWRALLLGRPTKSDGNFSLRP
jgi:ribosomal protein L11 methyltransferase